MFVLVLRLGSMFGLGKNYLVSDFNSLVKCRAEGSTQEQKSCLVTILHQCLTVPGLGLTSRELQSKCPWLGMA